MCMAMISSLTASSMYGYGDVDGPGFQPSGDDGLAHEKHGLLRGVT